MALEIFSDLSERLNYNIPGFPLYARKGELRQFERFTAACHWHPDLEFIFIAAGNIKYFVNGELLHINKGEGIFVNSKRLHYGFSDNNSDCLFIVVAVHPALLGENTHMCRAYISSKFGFDSEDYILLSNRIDWQKNILRSMTRIYDAMPNGKSNPLHLLSSAASLCACVADHIQPISIRQVDEHIWPAVLEMTGFIHKNYENRITLDDIAAAGSVCRSKCCKLFNEFVGQTPNTYLTRYRIYKSCDMLRESAMSVCEISLACGFQSPSYFTQIFQKEIGLTPRDYRNQSNT